MNKPMKDALRYTRKVKVVREWPPEISDATIKTLRKQGYLNTYEHINPWMHIDEFAMRITDELSEKGRTALERNPRVRGA